MKEDLLPLRCLLGFHKLERRVHPRNWRTCRRCGHTIFDRPAMKTARTPGTTPGWLIALVSVAPGLAFVAGIIAGRWGM